MQQVAVDQNNRSFWDELCGTNLARSLGITSAEPESLQRFDAEFFRVYPYLNRYADPKELRGKKVLEIGLGYGTLGQHLANCSGNYYGLDIAEAPVRMMQLRLGILGVADAESRVLRGSALENPYPDETFDCVYSIGCLHHTGNLQRAVDEVFRVLKPGGTAMIMLYNANSFRRLVRTPIDVAYTIFKSGPRGWVAKWRENERAMYDANVSGDAAPHTDYTSIRSAKRIFRRFTDIVIEKQNADPIKFPYYIPRERLLDTIGRRLGLDLYIRAVKPQFAQTTTRSVAA